ncbi:aldehyde dehydrogenase family protein [Inhella sp.]|uniref:aldehyde dehydrogenase family protein n=1 Tax=Inhella sp. TaxID=1921806 RepID=UPI0035B26DE6
MSFQSFENPGPVPHHIGGRRLELGPLQALEQPATGRVARWVHQAEGPQIVQALAAAQVAQGTWAQRAPGERLAVLQRFQRLLEDGRERLVALLVAELGRTLPEAEAEVARTLAHSAADTTLPPPGRHLSESSDGLDQWTQGEPLGVVVGVAPFCDPLALPLSLLVPALLSGNAFIWKPSPLTPSCSLFVAEALLAAGAPPGLVQVLQGGPEVAMGLLHHPEVEALSVAGRSETARALYAAGGQLGKRVQALGGAKNHLVVMPDADLDAAASALLQSAFGGAGQQGLATAAVVLVGSAGDALMPRLAERVRQLRVGPPGQPGVQLGPLISRAAKERVEALVHSAELDGARLWVDGRGVQVAGHLQGHYLGGSLIDHVQPWMRIYQEEVYGPVLLGLRVRSLEAALELLQEQSAAQAVGLFTRDGGTARAFARAVPAGQVGINVPLPQPAAGLGLGGSKAGLLGGHPLGGAGQWDFYTRRKAVMQRW